MRGLGNFFETFPFPFPANNKFYYNLLLAGRVPDNILLLAGRVTDNNLLLAGRVPDNNLLLAGRVPDNNSIHLLSVCTIFQNMYKTWGHHYQAIKSIFMVTEIKKFLYNFLFFNFFCKASNGS